MYATARRLESMQELTHSNIERVPMDVTDDASVQAAVGQIVQKEGRIDILVNNAGMTCSGRSTNPLYMGYRIIDQRRDSQARLLT